MGKKEIACLVSTPYHLLTVDNILSMPEYTDVMVDIYVVGKAVKQQVDYLRVNKNVKDILDYSDYFIKRFSWLERNRAYRSMSVVKDLYNCKKRMRLSGNNRIYQEMLIPYPSIPVQVMVQYFRKINKNLCINTFEDGVGTYLLGSYRHEITHFVFKTIFDFDIWSLISVVYVYQPDILVDNTHNKDLRVVKITPRYQGAFVQRVLKVHEEDIKAFEKVKIIIFDQFLMGDFPKQLKEEITLVQEIGKLFGKESVILKIHPRTPADRLLNLPVQISSSRLPFEVVMQRIDMEKVILISPCSTACLTPKIILNKEPHVALLYKMFFEQLGDSWDILVKNVQSLYIQKDRMVVPKTYDELFVWFKKIL